MKQIKQLGCFYCEHNLVQKNRMMEIIPLSVSTVYLNKDQTYEGRVIVALNWHVDEIFELDESQRNMFFSDVSLVAKILKKYFNADKINYGIYGDEVSHLHVHIVPKKKNAFGFGEAFINNPQKIKNITEHDQNRLIKDLKKELEVAFL